MVVQCLFYADFGRFKRDEFEYNIIASVQLRVILRSLGIFVDINKSLEKDDIAKALMTAAKTYRPWTEEEVKTAILNREEFKSRNVIKLFKEDLNKIAQEYSQNKSFDTSYIASAYTSPATVIRTTEQRPPTPYRPPNKEPEIYYGTGNNGTGNKGKTLQQRIDEEDNPRIIQQRIEENWPEDPRRLS
ncbi:hypothetical protein ACMFMG_005055 [Clarireedia jacksonii]